VRPRRVLFGPVPIRQGGLSEKGRFLKERYRFFVQNRNQRTARTGNRNRFEQPNHPVRTENGLDCRNHVWNVTAPLVFGNISPY
jgi:hypothetical protein